MEIELKDIDAIIRQEGGTQKAVIPVLQAIQEKYNYLPEEALRRVCEVSEITPARIVGVASFYSQFRFRPAGQHMIKVCVGTACHVKGAGLVYDAVKRELGLEEHEDTTSSGTYTIEKVNCLGCCTLAPVVQIDQVTYGHVTTSQVATVLSDFESQKESPGRKKYKYADGTEVRGEIRIGLGSCCVASGSDEIRDAVESTIERKGLNVKLKHVGCVGMCHQVPLVEIVPADGESTLYSRVKAADVDQIVQEHFQPAGLLKRLSGKLLNAADTIRDDSRWTGVDRYALDVREKHVSLFLDKQIPMATEFRGIINPLDAEEYRSRDGFKGLARELKEMKPRPSMLRSHPRLSMAQTAYLFTRLAHREARCIWPLQRWCADFSPSQAAALCALQTLLSRTCAALQRTTGSSACETLDIVAANGRIVFWPICTI